MAPVVDKIEPAKQFVKIFDLTNVLPNSTHDKYYHILLGGPEMQNVKDAVEKLEKLFNIRNIVLKSGDAALPEMENIEILFFLDNISVKFKPNGTQSQKATDESTPRTSPKVARLNNSVAYFLNTLRSTPLSDVADSEPKGPSSSSEVAENELGNETTHPPKRKRIRKHKRKAHQANLANYGSLTAENDENGKCLAPAEPETNGLHALYALKDSYEKPPIFKKSL